MQEGTTFSESLHLSRTESVSHFHSSCEEYCLKTACPFSRRETSYSMKRPHYARFSSLRKLGSFMHMDNKTQHNTKQQN